MSNTNRNKSEVTREQIEQRAYELYLQRGGIDGTDLEDWLVAERELLGEQDRSESLEGSYAATHAHNIATPSTIREETSNPADARKSQGAAAGKRSGD